MLFSIGLGGGHQTNTPLKNLVKEPLTKFDNLLGKKGDNYVHEENKYLVTVVEAGKNIKNWKISKAIFGNIADETGPLHDDRSFILRFQINADNDIFEKYLRAAPSNATYISKNRQMEFIDCCKK